MMKLYTNVCVHVVSSGVLSVKIFKGSFVILHIILQDTDKDPVMMLCTKKILLPTHTYF